MVAESEWTKIDARLRRLAAEITELVEELKRKAGKEAEALRPRLREAENKLRELKDSGGEAWEDLKPGMKKAWEELRQSLAQAASRFRSNPEK